MNLAFYYHIQVAVDEKGVLSVPGFLGVFLDAIAREVKQFYLVAHTYTGSDEYILNSTNIVLIDLGKSKPAWYRHIFHHLLLSKIKRELYGVDAIIIRSPSPLAPFFYLHLPEKCLIVYYLVGSYATSAKEIKPRSFREWLVKEYLYQNDREFRKRIKNKDILVNSPKLIEDYSTYCKSIVTIPTTTLTEKDFYFRSDTCLADSINLLFTGRLDLHKGLVELIEAFASLSVDYSNLYLNFVGWEDDFNKPVEKYLKRKVIDYGLQSRVFFHGKRRVGEDLWYLYRSSDIYIIPSYHEGFPRTIWEAMANSMPVVATRVGAIPFYLQDKQSVLLIEPKNIEEIVQAVKNLIEDSSLRQRLISKAMSIVKENTVNNRAKQMVRYVEQAISSS